MSKFSDLLKSHPGVLPEDLQKEAQERFSTLLREHGLGLRQSEQILPEVGEFLVIGVAAGYSQPDMLMLDDLGAAFKQVSHCKVEIFDASLLKTTEDFDRFIPGIRPVFQTPVVGFWVDGELRVRKSGKEATDFVQEKFVLKRGQKG